MNWQNNAICAFAKVWFQQDAHVKAWHLERMLERHRGITTEDLLNDLRQMQLTPSKDVD